MDIIIPQWAIFVFIGMLGLMLGSFLNSWMWRTQMGIRGGRSMCVSCQKKLHWYENVPLASYVALHGKCLVCKAQIPFDYFLVELITPILFIWLSIYHLRFPVFNSGHMLRDVIFVILLIIIFVYDAKYQMILSGVVWAGAAIGLAFNFFVLQYCRHHFHL